jgi:uncharacterized protein DUF6582
MNNTYPIDTEKHIHAAWSSIHHERDAAFSSPADVACIERRIQQAAAAQGINLGS